jgi:tRNA 2-selenouridine synthase
MIKKLTIEEFVQLSQQQLIVDVRSPGEYHHAHIPNAVNIPLFTDEERKIIGTAYKQRSREQAIKIGLDFFGPKMKTIVELVEALIKDAHPNSPTTISHHPVYIHCARGGMRSAAVAWLLDLYGLKINSLVGGYKAFRNWTIQQFEKKYAFKILGGNTGSGKTYLLQELSKTKNIIDLEGLANHKGSAFGSIGMPQQPSQEMFENLLATQLNLAPKEQQIWLEDESQRIGNNLLPHAIWNQMREAPVYFMNIPFEERLKHITQEYGRLPKEALAAAITKISKRLGGLETKTALAFLEENDIQSCFSILLKYYDKHYQKGLQNRQNLAGLLTIIDFQTVDSQYNLNKLYIV